MVQPDIHQEIRERVHEIKVKTEENEEKEEISLEAREAKIHEQLKTMVDNGCISDVYDTTLDNSIEFRAFCDKSKIIPIFPF